MSLAQQTRILEAVTSGACDEAVRTIAMTGAIRAACDPDISDFMAELREADRQADKAFFKRHGVWPDRNLIDVKGVRA